MSLLGNIRKVFFKTQAEELEEKLAFARAHLHVIIFSNTASGCHYKLILDGKDATNLIPNQTHFSKSGAAIDYQVNWQNKYLLADKLRNAFKREPFFWQRGQHSGSYKPSYAPHASKPYTQWLTDTTPSQIYSHLLIATCPTNSSK
jgi:hypothetical protein